MGPRRRSREFALQMAFQKEFTPELSYKEILQNYVQSFPLQEDILDYGSQLIYGVENNKTAIDEMIQMVSRHWKISRMAFVDLNIARIATFEMFFLEPHVPPGIAINEALEMAKRFGSEESSSFVNGLLDQMVARQRKTELP